MIGRRAVWIFVIALTAWSAPKPLPWLGMKFRWIKDGSGARIQHVERVTPNGPAAHTGLRSGDLIHTMAGRAVGFGDDLEFLLYLSERKPGERLRLGIVREGRSLDLTLTVGTMPESSRAAWNAALAHARQKRIAASARE